VTIFAAETAVDSIIISKSLREAGINTELYPNPQSRLDKQLKYADRKGIGYVIIAGPDEVAKNVVKLKDLKNQSQETLPIDSVIEKLNNR
jgi:histidyl-tRNA synthetase